MCPSSSKITSENELRRLKNEHATAKALNFEIPFSWLNFPDESKLMYKAASGSIEYINIFEVSNINSTLKNLKDKNFWVYGFDGNGKIEFTEIEWKGNNILLFGSEGFGMHEHTTKYADFLVRIDINKKIESLNISNSAAIVFHHLSFLKKKS